LFAVVLQLLRQLCIGEVSALQQLTQEQHVKDVTHIKNVILASKI